MGYLGVYRAIYEYAPQAEGELTVNEGDLLLVTEKSEEDDWWKAKRKAGVGEEEEPEGLVPSTYIEEAAELYQARALYDYTRQTDEEVSFIEYAVLQVFDESDPDWVLVGYGGEYGFAPANYIEKAGGPEPPPAPAAVDANKALPDRPIPGEDDYVPGGYGDYASPAETPAAAIANLIQQKTGQQYAAPSASRSIASPVQYTPEASDDEGPPPALPQRPEATPPRPQYDESESRGVMASPKQRSQRGGYEEDYLPTPTGYHLYNIHEMISHMGKNKKMPTTLGINVAAGTIMIAPEKAKDGPSREWTADKLTHYSLEGKHVFMELVKPSKSIDFHAGAKDTAQEIVSALGELAGAARAEGLREVIAAGSTPGQKKGRMLYEFMAQADDEVTVAVGDDVIVIDDTSSAEWWVVRRLKNGKEGSVPSSYVEVTGTVAATPRETVRDSPRDSPRDTGSSTIEQNRRDEERMAMESARSSSRSDRSQRDQRSTSSTLKPDLAKVRSWTDRSGTFKVEAEFLGLKDGKIHLHKMNGVKIAVPVGKMSLEDIEYVERATGHDLGDEKPLSEIKRRGTDKADRRSDREQPTATSSRSTADAAAQQPEPPRYDWFDFFLACGVHPQICERYAGTFEKDQMGEENMQDIDPTLLRNLGVKEGDVLRVMKYLDNKFGRSKAAPAAAADGAEADGGLFSGPDGGLRNNTRKGRPAPAVQTNDTVDAKAFDVNKSQPAESARPTKPSTSGFDDDAWDVKPSKTSTPAPAPVAPTPQRPMPTGTMADLSLLSPPLQPSPAPAPAPAATAASLQPQKTGADPSFFDQLARPSSTQQNAMARQRPPPSGLGNQSSMLPPAPQRPMSTPQNNYPQTNGGLPPPLMPQRTGLTQIAPPGQSMAEINQQRMMQQSIIQQPLYPQPTGFGYGQVNGMMPQATGFGQYPQQPQQTGFGQQQFMQPMQPQPTGFQTPYLTAQPTGNPFGDSARAPFTPLQPQQTGFQPPYQQLQPQQTGFGQPQFMQPQPTGMNGFGGGYQGGFGQQPYQTPSQLPPMQQQQPIAAALVPQKTGPAPPVRFGMPAQKLTAQPTGRRANLASATPQNPFGF